MQRNFLFNSRVGNLQNVILKAHFLLATLGLTCTFVRNICCMLRGKQVPFMRIIYTDNACMYYGAVTYDINLR